MNLKRGMFCVVVVLFLLLSVSVAVAYRTYEIVSWQGNCDEDDECSEVLPLAGYRETLSDNNWASACNSADWEEMPGSFPLSTARGIAGCYIEFLEEDPPNSDDCAWVAISPGNKIGKTDQTRALPLSSATVVQEGNDATSIFSRTADGKSLIADEGGELLCNSDEKWYECDENNNGQHLIINVPTETSPGATKTFYCLHSADNSWRWLTSDELSSADSDGDGEPDDFDCDPTEGNVHGNFPRGCNPGVEGSCQTGEQIPEKCGDGIDNDCNPATTEDSCANSKTVCESAANKLSWIDGTSNSCCGDNPSQDLGVIASGSYSGGLPDDYICLNSLDAASSPEYVGHSSGDIKADVDPSEWSETSTRCQGDWCWVKATSDKFNIYTIHKTNEQYDVVSNGVHWVECSAQNVGDTALDTGANRGSDFNTVNQFYCYNDGTQWSIAQCLADVSPGQSPAQENVNAKQRIQGDGLFALAQTSPSVIDFTAETYSRFYGTHGLNLPDNSNLEFTVAFNPNSEITMPADITLTIHGLNNQILFEQNVLSYATNTPLIEPGRSLHILVPLPANIRAVRRIDIVASPGGLNTIEIKNIYVSSSTIEPKLCSGSISPTPADSSWLQNIDYWSSTSFINGENICKSVYGDNAWIGGSEVSDSTAHCCGNANNEYYPGNSHAENLEDAYACWNSIPLKNGDTTTNVEFEVGYNLPQFEISYPAVSFSYINGLGNSGQIIPSSVTSQNSPIRLSEHIINKDDYSTEELEIGNSNDPFSSGIFYRLILCQEDGCQYLPNNPEQVRLYYVDAETGEDLGSEFYVGELPNQLNTIYAMAALTEPVIDAVAGTPITVLPETKEYACLEEPCLYSLPGEAPYSITNLHPGLYDLYFASGNTEQEQTLITQENQQFNVAGNILVKRVPKPVIFEKSDEASGFYGCNAPDYLTIGTGVENQPFCSVKAGKFCSYNSEEGINAWSDDPLQKVLAVSNKISTEEKLEFVDFVAPNVLRHDPRDDTNGKDTPFKPEDRTSAATAVPGKNLIQNPHFLPDEQGQYVPGWEIVASETRNEASYVENPNHRDENGALILGEDDVLKSEKIPVPGAKRFSLTQEGDCPAVVAHLVNNNGEVTDILEQDLLQSWAEELGYVTGSATQNINPEATPPENQGVLEPAPNSGIIRESSTISLENTLPSFLTSMDTSYIIVEYARTKGIPGIGRLVFPTCTIKNPYLQIIDDKGAAEFDAAEADQQDLRDLPRSAAACCPTNYCWNGYACVEPMGFYTSISEHIGEGRDYRCIDGNWEAATKKTDWAGLSNGGFCEQEGQCFVMDSADPDSDSQYTAAEFYQGRYPTCINNGEYILDNYCDDGEWSSRTKIVASKLIEANENGRDYTVYCTNYKDALTEYTINEGILRGIEPSQEQTLGDSIPPLNVCFPNIKGKGKELIPDEENTCVNNVCVLVKKKLWADDDSVLFATTFNDNPDNLFQNLGATLSLQQCAGQDFARCDVGLAGDLYYDSSLSAVIYDRDGLGIQAGTVEEVVDFIKSIFLKSSAISPGEILPELQNLRKIYYLQKTGKKVLAVQEITPEQKPKLMALYENFETPICDYVDDEKIASIAVGSSLSLPQGPALICTDEGTLHRIEATSGLDYLWPQLTGKLRPR